MGKKYFDSIQIIYFSGFSSIKTHITQNYATLLNWRKKIVEGNDLVTNLIKKSCIGKTIKNPCHCFKREVYKNVKITKRMMFSLLAVVAIAGLGSAAWFLGYTSSGSSGYMISSEGVSYSDDFSVEENSTTNQSLSKVEKIYISNPDGNFTLVADIEILNDDVTDGCNNSGDVEVIIEYLGAEISDGDNITIVPGTTELTVTTDVVKYACPQNISTTIELA